MNELKKHVFANTVDRVVLKKLVRRLFPRCRCREIHERIKENSQVQAIEVYIVGAERQR